MQEHMYAELEELSNIVIFDQLVFDWMTSHMRKAIYIFCTNKLCLLIPDEAEISHPFFRCAQPYYYYYIKFYLCTPWSRRKQL